MVDPKVDTEWKSMGRHITTDGVHQKDRVGPDSYSPGRSPVYPALPLLVCLSLVCSLSARSQVCVCVCVCECELSLIHI